MEELRRNHVKLKLTLHKNMLTKIVLNCIADHLTTFEITQNRKLGNTFKLDNVLKIFMLGTSSL